MISAIPDSRAAQRGFTLLELLVAITLLGLLMAALFGGLRLGARIWETSVTRLDASSRVQIVQGFLRQRLAEMLPVSVVVEESGREAPWLRGAPDSLRFASLLPEHLGSGVYLMELALDDAGDVEKTRNLVLRWRPFEPRAQTGAPAHERVLLERVSAIELAYFGALDPRAMPVWSRDWQGQSAPRLIRLQVRVPAGDIRSWPELIVRRMVDSSLAGQF
ncbi:MAG: prepilin-type N-terminal cleavage/methylation domain-containing protein [Geminicoccaceae bacterium]